MIDLVEGAGSGGLPRSECNAAARMAVVVLMFGAPPVMADPYAVAYERDAVTVMRDGTKLRADIYRPGAEGKFPVLLQRTPYGKNGGVEFGLKAAARGYIVVIQDVRGRYASEGDWYPFKNESSDGYDTVEWAASLLNPPAKWECLATHTWGPRSCWLRSLIHRI
jgi:predicted acyl esterase